MKTIGIICEYNPFHNGHIYHINKIKELFPDSLIVLVVTNNFTERGSISVLNKKEKTEIALNHNIDLVVELPFKFACSSADTFAEGSIKILKELKVDYLVFGSESNNIDKLINLANIQLKSKEYSSLVKSYLKEGINYPTALSKALKEITNTTVEEPNDLLGLSYVKEIIKQKTNINAITIKRSNDYHKSSTDIRNSLNKNSIKEFVPDDVYKVLKNKKDIDYFKYIKYKILTDKDLSIYLDVDEGIENRLLKYINECNNLDDFIKHIKTKRYTYNKINRMLIHILTSYTKIDNNTNLDYIRILGFNKLGKEYLNKIKKDINVPVITNIKKKDEVLLNTDIKVEKIYSLITNNDLNSYKDPVIYLDK
ncbi:MAG: nucleotidyltransferase [Bacilli bacterium]|nr:nucleotidyltransferase [Bacilli bacterium]